jgi:hypothetical protein
LKPRYARVITLIIALTVGGFFSLLPSSTPAFSSNLPDGVILAQSSNLNLTTNSLVRYSHTLFVSSSSSPAQNGTALLLANDVIANSNPSATNPYLLKLEPGQYDLGNRGLILLPFTDLEGSGENSTIISSTIGSNIFIVGNSTLKVASNTETRFVKILNSGSAHNQIAIFVPINATNVHFTHLTSNASGGFDSFSIGNNGRDTTLTDSHLSATGGSNTSVGFGNAFNSTAIVQNSTMSASGADSNFGLANNGITVTVQNSNLNSTGGTNSYGLYNKDGKVTVQNSSLSAIGNTNSYGLYNSGRVTVQNSTLSATGGAASNYGLMNGGDTAIVQNSTLTATGGTSSYGLNDIAGEAQVGASQLSGTTAASFGLTHCPASYNGLTFVLLTAACL